MKKNALLIIMGCLLATSCARQGSQRDAERYIIESERQWAESATSGDSSIVERILADDFVGVDPEGRLYDKAKMISMTPDGPKLFVSNHANATKVRFYGDAVVAQGDETWERRSGEPRQGRFVWTDTWVKRNGKWQIVAAEDLITPEQSTGQ